MTKGIVGSYLMWSTAYKILIYVKDQFLESQVEVLSSSPKEKLQSPMVQQCFGRHMWKCMD